MKYDSARRTLTFESTGRVISDVEDEARYMSHARPAVVFYTIGGPKMVTVNDDERREFADDQIAMWAEWRDGEVNQ